MLSSKIIKIIDNLVFPRRCLACGKNGSYLCPHCLSHLPIREENKCPYCEKENTKFGELCPKCKKRKNYFLDGLIVSSYYQHPLVNSMLKNFKFSSIPDFSPLLANLLFLKVKKLGDQFPFADFILCPVPIHNLKKRERSFNQTELILYDLTSIAKENKICLKTDFGLIKKIKYHAPQSKTKSLKARRDNVRGTFRVSTGGKVIPEKIILLDDISTTGATLNEIAKTLKEKGVTEVWGLVLARQKFD